MKHEGLGILHPWLLAERSYNTPKTDSDVLVGSLIGKDLADGSGLNRLRWATENGEQLTAITHHLLNGTEFSREEFQYNLHTQ